MLEVIVKLSVLFLLALLLLALLPLSWFYSTNPFTAEAKALNPQTIKGTIKYTGLCVHIARLYSYFIGLNVHVRVCTFHFY